jgi:pyruvate, orthophosphate dikinase
VDEEGVGQLIAMTISRARAANPNLHFGVCGEQGGEPHSVKFFHRTGLHYVSCSPFRIPIARIAAAQAAIQAGDASD